MSTVEPSAVSERGRTAQDVRIALGITVGLVAAALAVWEWRATW